MENQGVNGCCGEVGEQQAAVASLGAGQGEESIPPCGERGLCLHVGARNAVLHVGKGELAWLKLIGCLP